MVEDKPVLEIDVTRRLEESLSIKGKIWVDAKTKTVVRFKGQPPVVRPRSIAHFTNTSPFRVMFRCNQVCHTPGLCGAGLDRY
jgi:hypothetical protein